MTPSEILQAAADRIRDLAAAVTPGPWETIASSGGIWREASAERAVRTSPGYLGGMNAAEDARWIAALSPAVAPALERLLRDAAKDWGLRAPALVEAGLTLEQNSRRFSGALALARALCPELAEEKTP